MKPITDAYKAILESERPDEFEPQTGAEQVAFAQYRQAKRGKIRHAIEITDRVEGKLTQRLAGAEDTEFKVVVRRVE